MKLGLLAFAVLTLAFAPGSPAAAPPNVVFILADDLGWGELGCYGQQKIPTPNIDRLAAQGMRFTQHYSGAPVCAPSRCVLMTGKHLGHAEVRGNQQARVNFPEFTEGQYPLGERALTIAQVFKKAGYATGAMGKWGLGPVGSTGDPNRKGFDLFYGYNCQAVAHSFYPPHIWRNAEKIALNAKRIPGHAKQPEGEVKLDDWIGETYAPKLMIAEAEKFIAANAARPFFLYLPFIEPHVAMHPPRESVEKFPVEWDHEVYRGANGYLPHPRPRAGYAAMIHDLDSYVGRVLAALDRAAVADRTLVIFTSDNGTTHEGRIRVPMIARLPGRIAAGAVNDTPGYFADWFPTLCDAAGFEKPGGLDGESLWPVLNGERRTLDARKPMIWIFPEYGGQVAERLGHFKLVRQGLKTNLPGAWEVYDLSKDHAEVHEIAASHAELIRQAEEILRREVDENKVFPLTIPGVKTAAR